MIENIIVTLVAIVISIYFMGCIVDNQKESELLDELSMAMKSNDKDRVMLMLGKLDLFYKK